LAIKISCDEVMKSESLVRPWILWCIFIFYERPTFRSKLPFCLHYSSKISLKFYDSAEKWNYVRVYSNDK